MCQTRPVVRYDLRRFGPPQGITALRLAGDGGRCAQCYSTLRKLLCGHFHFCRHCDDAFPADEDGRAFYDWSDECERCGNFIRECLVCGCQIQARGYSSTQWNAFKPSVCLQCFPDENVEPEQEQVEQEKEQVKQEQPRQPDGLMAVDQRRNVDSGTTATTWYPRVISDALWKLAGLQCYYYDDANIPLVFWDNEERRNILITGSYDLLFLTYTEEYDQEEEFDRRQSRTAVGTVEIWDDPIHPFVAKDTEQYGTSYRLQGRGKIDNAFFDIGWFYPSFTFGIQDGEEDDTQPGVGSILDDNQPDHHEMRVSEVTLGWIAQRTALPWIPADCVDHHDTYADRVRRQMTEDARLLTRITEGLLPYDDGAAIWTKIREYLIPPLQLALEPGDLCLSIVVNDGSGNEAWGKLVARRRQSQRT
jgi:hypothetical protein